MFKTIWYDISDPIQFPKAGYPRQAWFSLIPPTTCYQWLNTDSSSIRAFSKVPFHENIRAGSNQHPPTVCCHSWPHESWRYSAWSHTLSINLTSTDESWDLQTYSPAAMLPLGLHLTPSSGFSCGVKLYGSHIMSYLFMFLDVRLRIDSA